jgi:hypothetical protein
VSASTALHLAPDDKLDALRYLDEFRYWHSLDDQRICKRCGHRITGSQILVIELPEARGKLRLQCPSPDCISTPGHWTYPDPVQAAKLIPSLGRASHDRAIQIIASEPTHAAKRAPNATMSAAPSRHSIVAAAHPVRAVLARLILLRPIATALHAFCPTF